MSELQAVFWDMDGTLVDTEPYWIESEYKLVKAHGGTWNEEKAHLLVGQALSYSAGILQEAGVQMSAQQIIDHLTAQVVAKCAESIPWRPGARDLLAELQAEQVRAALVTMSFTPLARAIHQALPAGQLEFIVTGDMVSAGKPDPEAYHLAFDKMAADHAERTGAPLQRSRCIAIEDSVPGTAAATASGMVTLAIPHYTPLPETGQWHVFDTLDGARVEHLRQLLVRDPVPAV
ncbi:HAD family hydrolase [Nesterenkonia ebinurensis]|uniref:HAD family hydrolase n=1 Tax=Nesterenkonia ebinurensis TaxID=2608252 RepID=UPI001CC7684A|nr:HAD family hydrolase [Nesterenkonia ebinurensis]